MVDKKLMIDELVAKLGFDNIRALSRLACPVRYRLRIVTPITEEQLSRAANAVANRHDGDNGERHE
jgi:hypothetical protein